MLLFQFRKWWIRAKYIAVFLLVSIILYELFHWIGGWFEPVGRYREPVGKAVKAFRAEESAGEPKTIADRLLFFYKYGE
ncbi:DUF4227 family protein [Paenibacillus ginsengarvi]|uniref:DUF4227 family protein n=1 Tax=Paenibacillus ginsengarvi TaxID=400777 RepID=A0A3B0CK54_9BACL|nr:DUF4227 family protein [Paenibacillus ginsengarvi]RKN84659.1 DUF4227 family protein [Paenibacillus ginsengarvi]